MSAAVILAHLLVALATQSSAVENKLGHLPGEGSKLKLPLHATACATSLDKSRHLACRPVPVGEFEQELPAW